MNNQDFLKEVMASDCCPENFEQIYRGFQEYQKKVLDTLRAFHEVCEKNSIPYQLIYGSLLGAVRENGQIPWDYDVDVMVPYCEKNRLVEALRRDLPGAYYFYCPDTDSKCRHYMMRLAPKGYRTEALHVDVFYAIGAPENARERSEFTKEVYRLFYERYWKLVDIREASSGSIKIMAKLLFHKLRLLGRSVKDIDVRFEELCAQHPFWESVCCVGVDSWCNKCVYQTKKMWQTQLKETNDGTFRITDAYHEVLEAGYGNYMEKPPLHTRLQDMLWHYGKLQSMCSK